MDFSRLFSRGYAVGQFPITWVLEHNIAGEFSRTRTVRGQVNKKRTSTLPIKITEGRDEVIHPSFFSFLLSHFVYRTNNRSFI